jgi:ATP/maltotriose-dependent transcriptional regulator MalT
MQRAARYRVILLLAGAGYGKSEALLQFWVRLDAPKVLCRLSKSACTLSGFVHAISDSCTDIAPEMASSAASALRASLDTSDPIEALVSWTGAHLRDFRGVIALEDFENADQGDLQVSQFVDRLISQFQTIRWVIASRYSGSIQVAKWIAQEISDLPISSNDLAFTVEEALTLARRLNSQLTDDAIRDAVQRLAGWPFALAIEFRVSATSGALSSQSQQLTMEYLATQVWSVLSEEERRFSELAAVVPTLTIQQATRAGFDNAVKHAQAISSRLPFVYFVDDRFTMHELFRGFIIQQVLVRGHSKYIDLLLTGADVLSSDGNLADALEVVMQTEDTEYVRDFIRNRELQLCNVRYRDILKRALGFLPKDDSESIAFLKMVCACDDADPIAYKYGEQLLLNPNLRPDLVKPTILYVSRCVTVVGDDNIAAAKSPLVHAALLDDDSVIAMREAVRAWSDASHGQTAEIASRVSKIEEMLPTLQARDRALVLNALGGACIWADRLEQGRRYLDEALAVSITAGDGVMAARSAANSVVAIVNDPFAFSGLEEAVQRARHICARSGQWTTLRAMLEAYGVALIWSGRWQEASVVEAELASLPKPLISDVSKSVDFIRACICAMSGDLSGSGRVLERVVSNQLKHDDPMSKAYAAIGLIMLATISALNSNTEMAESALRRYDELESAKKRHPYLQHLEIVALMALGRFTLAGRIARRLDATRLGVAPLGRWYQILRGDRYSAAVRADLRSHQHTPGAGLIAQLLEQLMDAWELQRESPERLTKSELAILQMLKLDMSNKEIAAARLCSEATVKVHVGSIIRKLSASSRRSAVAAAVRQGLLV